MHRWDRLVERYIEEYRARGRCEATIEITRQTLDKWGAWLKRRKPRVHLESVEPQLFVDYLEARSSFRAKTTVYSHLSKMRGFGDFHAELTRQAEMTGLSVPEIRPEVNPADDPR